jgi:hypothetical protein
MWAFHGPQQHVEVQQCSQRSWAGSQLQEELQAKHLKRDMPIRAPTHP